MNSIEGGSRGSSRSIGGSPGMGGMPHGDGGIATAPTFMGSRSEHAFAAPSFPMPEGGIPMADTKSILPNVAPRKSASWESISLDTNKQDENAGPFQTLWSANDRKASPFDKIMGPSVPLVVHALPSQDRRMLNSPNVWSEIHFDKPVSASPLDAKAESPFVKIIQIPHSAEVTTVDTTQESSRAEAQIEGAIQTIDQTHEVVERAVEEIRTEFALAREIGEMQIEGVSQEVMTGIARRAFAHSVESKRLAPFLDAAVKSKSAVKTAEEASKWGHPEGVAQPTHEAVVADSPESNEKTGDKGVVARVDSQLGEEAAPEAQPQGGIKTLLNTKAGKALDYKASVLSDPDDVEDTRVDTKTKPDLATNPAQQVSQETQTQLQEDADTVPEELGDTEKKMLPGQDFKKDDPQKKNQWIKDDETNAARAKALQEAVQKAKEKRDEELEGEEVDDSTIVMNTFPINDALLSHGEDPNQIPTEQIVDELEGKEHELELQSEPLRVVPSAIDKSWTEALEEIETLDDITPEDAETQFRETLDDKTAVTIVDFSRAHKPTDVQIQRVMKDHPIDLEAFRRRKAA